VALSAAAREGVSDLFADGGAEYLTDAVVPPVDSRKAVFAMGLKVLVKFVIPAAILGSCLSSMYFYSVKQFRIKRHEVRADFARRMVEGYMSPNRQAHAYIDARKSWFFNKPLVLDFYLDRFFENLDISTDTIQSLKRGFSLFQLTDVEIADALDRASTRASKEWTDAESVLFVAQRILKTEEGLAVMEPMKEMLAESWDGQEYLDKSLVMIQESAYKRDVANTSPLANAPYWGVLGIEKERALEIHRDYNEQRWLREREKVTEEAAEYEKYKKEKEEEKAKQELKGGKDEVVEEKKAGTGAGVHVCLECGHVLPGDVSLPGSQHAFHKDDFTCPNCGADKDMIEFREFPESEDEDDDVSSSQAFDKY
jgi:rubrerythrin